ncbi:hypothetical protein ES288_D10G089100v1 [Gossypium darwinii]|uniref:Uncharacterized protein n=1 Tax=Gossypium darwinii TaxID=34276 RepID=A0A5D2AXM8_GOSDA|nr:hypothetical protein ES288_D10G089100v1 [Gossypium darwinii]
MITRMFGFQINTETNQTSFTSRFKVLSYGQFICMIPVSKCWNLPTSLAIIILVKQAKQEKSHLRFSFKEEIQTRRETQLTSMVVGCYFESKIKIRAN